MNEKIIETKLAILDRILAIVNDKEKELSAKDIYSLANIVNNFDTTENLKEKSLGFFGSLIQKPEEPEEEKPLVFKE